jgi:hypothetical protein
VTLTEIKRSGEEKRYTKQLQQVILSPYLLFLTQTPTTIVSIAKIILYVVGIIIGVAVPPITSHQYEITLLALFTAYGDVSSLIVCEQGRKSLL